ncbi:metal ABC transporter permease [Rubinisphaera margarita]|uniref:metal ABC transporter permease n=1 Tax=Rubinisphaera margarita TaxID=2909586 RepID=UPI001EE972D1|nr:metal ABC transporter permease [Rubinisphaera margarita]MCG6155809.1 metal ABC transporter permease [Rubinisphaera margarita]
MLDWPAFLDPTMRLAFWTILVGTIANVTCAILGCFLVLRRMSMLGDALSHAVLPGLAIAFLLTGTTAAVPMFVGAAVFAMLTAGLSRLLTTYGHATEESGLGIVFTAFFALGILLVQMFAEKVHLDRDVVLEGAIEYVALETITLFGLRWPTAFWTTSAILAASLLWLGLFWKEIKAAVFDPMYAAAIGLYGQTMLGVLVVLVAICVVGSFKIVGSILVVAMLIVPGATAQLVSQRLVNMLVLSGVFAAIATAFGYAVAWHLNTSAAGMMAVFTGLGYGLALVFSPSQGLLVTRLRRARLRSRIREEDLLGILFRWEEQRKEVDPHGSMSLERMAELAEDSAGQHRMQSSLNRLENAVLVEQTRDEGYVLTDRGRRAAQRLVRGHRLWESYLGSEFQLPEDHLHEAAHQIEHYLDQESREQIERELGSPESDPHGRSIPPRVTDPEN